MAMAFPPPPGQMGVALPVAQVKEGNCEVIVSSKGNKNGGSRKGKNDASIRNGSPKKRKITRMGNYSLIKMQPRRLPLLEEWLGVSMMRKSMTA
jgi:hypothetical protein